LVEVGGTPSNLEKFIAESKFPSSFTSAVIVGARDLHVMKIVLDNSPVHFLHHQLGFVLGTGGKEAPLEKIGILHSL
jgi:hypothetical protein